MRRALIFLLLPLLAGCEFWVGDGGDSDPGPAPRGGGSYTISMDVFPERPQFGFTATFRLFIRAESETVLTFPTGQRYDFEVYSGQDLIWRWSEDKLFTQAFGEVRIPAGDQVLYQEIWRPEAAGSYRAVGYVTATQRLQQQVAFTVEG